MKFGLVGGLATCVHASVGYVSVVSFGIAGMQANGVGFSCAWWVSFFGHHLFTFEGRANSWGAFVRFTVHSVALFLIAALITAALTMRAAFVPESLVPVIGALIVPIVSFLSSKYFVFRSAKP